MSASEALSGASHVFRRTCTGLTDSSIISQIHTVEKAESMADHSKQEHKSSQTEPPQNYITKRKEGKIHTSRRVRESERV